MSALQISVEELQSLLRENKPVQLLDVRPRQERNAWHIAGSMHLDDTDALLNGDGDVLNKLQIPENWVLVTVSATGNTSLRAAELLTKKGYTAYSLSGGIKAWNYAWNTASLTLSDGRTSLIQVRRVAKGCLSYLICSGKEALVVDASLDPEVYLKLAEAQGCVIRYVMDTHVHADFLSRTRELAAVTAAKHFFHLSAKVNYKFTPLRNGEELKFGSALLKVLHTPGHTAESTCYLINKEVLLTGDTLFTNDVGRPDLKVSKAEALVQAENLYNSLQQILSLSKNIKVLPAHATEAVAFNEMLVQAKLLEIKQKQELLRLPKDAFVEATISRIPATPPNYLAMASLNRQGNFEGHVPADLELVSNVGL